MPAQEAAVSELELRRNRTTASQIRTFLYAFFTDCIRVCVRAEPPAIFSGPAPYELREGTLVAQADCGGEQKLDDLAGKVVLIVENQPQYAQSLVKQLLFAGLEPVVAMTGEGGLKKGAERHLDLILLEAELSDMDGLEFVALVHQRLEADRIRSRGDEPVRAFKGEVPRRRL